MADKIYTNEHPKYKSEYKSKRKFALKYYTDDGDTYLGTYNKPSDFYKENPEFKKKSPRFFKGKSLSLQKRFTTKVARD